MILTRDNNTRIYFDKKDVLWASDDIKEGLLLVCFKGAVEEVKAFNLCSNNEVTYALREMNMA